MSSPEHPKARRVRVVVDLDASDAEAIEAFRNRNVARPSRSEVIRAALRRGLPSVFASNPAAIGVTL
jgi:metal-responsive CopG/Arc/MetJ family transcriptional regulator